LNNEKLRCRVSLVNSIQHLKNISSLQPLPKIGEEGTSPTHSESNITLITKSKT
jgi:hypothetical protein